MKAPGSHVAGNDRDSRQTCHRLFGWRGSASFRARRNDAWKTSKPHDVVVGEVSFDKRTRKVIQLYFKACLFCRVFVCNLVVFLLADSQYHYIL